MKHSALAILAIFAVLPVPVGAQSGAKPVSITRAPAPIPTGVLKKVVARGDRVYLLDQENHRVVIVSGSLAKTVGQIGNGPGDLYQPFDLDVDPHGRVYVHDDGNSRITIFDANGRSLGGFQDTPKSMGLAVNAAQEIYLGRPQLGSLITVCDRTGRTARMMGTIVRPSSLLGPAFAAYDGRAAAFNRVHLMLDDQGNIWAAFAFLPLLEKFGPDGRLLLKKRLSYPELQPVIASMSKPPGSRPPNAEMNFDGVQLPLVTRDVAWDAHGKHALLLLGNERIVVLDTDGHELASFFPNRDGGNLQNVSATGDGEVLASIFGAPYPYRLGAKPAQTTTERR
jgi:hypothetical protein